MKIVGCNFNLLKPTSMLWDIDPTFKNPGSAPCTLSLLQKRLQQLLLDSVSKILKR